MSTPETGSAPAEAGAQAAPMEASTESREVDRLRTEIDETRDELDTFVSELDRRRVEALDLKLQVRKHPGIAIGVGLAVVATALLGIAMVGAVVVLAREARGSRRSRRRRG
ncbi:MAG: hypothetical protein JNK60_02050 [Acidobacteria bacterium]|nr:hypothetical protein [Acidobacteriota bacterium]